MTLSANQVLNTRYQIKALLGKGEYGAVYYAWDQNLNSPVAVKELHNTKPDITQQFSLEARALANLRHPNLPYVIDHFSLPGSGGTLSSYLVMEFVEGENLQDIIDHYTQESPGKGMSEGQILPLMVQVFDAVSFLHSQKPAIIHRDIKPANIRVTSEQKAMLVDFGITKIADPIRRNTILTERLESVFVPPEMQAGVAEECSDVYSLGATLYTALTGTIPPNGIERRAGQPIRPLRQLNSAISPRVESAVMRALELSPERRFQSVDEFSTALGLKTLNAPIKPTQVVDYTGQENPANTFVPPTVVIRQASPIGHDQVLVSQPKQSKSWIVWSAVILGIVCLMGGIVSGVGLYTIFYSTRTPTLSEFGTSIAMPTEDQTSTETVETLLSTIPATSTKPQVTDTLASTSIPTWTSVLTLPSTMTFILPIPSPSQTETSPVSQTWSPCSGSYPSRLHVGDRAYVSFNPPLPNRVRVQPNTGSTIVGVLQPGEKMEIIGGPTCSNQWIWWQVSSLDKSLIGWTAEGDNQSYWLVPIP